jgi:hypothetical protein
MYDSIGIPTIRTRRRLELYLNAVRIFPSGNKFMKAGSVRLLL